MNMKIWLAAATGVVVLTGCAGPLSQKWDDPLYRSIQEQYRQRDRTASGLASSMHAIPSIEPMVHGPLRVGDAIRAAIHHNPELRSAGYLVDAASGRVHQAGLYPNPSLNFEAEAVGSDAGSGGETAYVIEQEIVLGGKLRKARSVAESDVLAARAGFVAQEYALATRVTRAYFAGVSAQEQLQKREELVALASQLRDAATSKVVAGTATMADQLRAEVVHEQALIELDSARFELESAMEVLASTIGVDSGIDLELESSIEQFPDLPSRESLLSATLEVNSRISLARIAVERARRTHKLARSNAAPDLVASIGPRYSDIDSETTIDVGLSIEIPLFDRNQGEISATLAERLSASAKLRGVQLELIAEVSKAWSLYQSSYAAVHRFRDQLLPKAEKTLELTRQAYQSGKSDYLRLLDAQQVVVQSHISYIRTLEQLQSAAALLNELSQTQAPWRGPRNEDHTERRSNNHE